MKKAIDFSKNHFIEVVGFTVIIVLVVLITYLRLYKKTYTCQSIKHIDGAKIYEKFVIKQKNNKIKSIDFSYKAKLATMSKEDFKALYNSAVNEVLSDFENVETSYKNNTIYVSYTLTYDDIKDNKAYKTARTFMKNIKANGFSCK